MNAADLLIQFESLGDNCEFGLVQRRAGIEPLGFFRLNFATRLSLIRALEDDFKEVCQPERLEIEIARNGELMAKIKDYGFTYHTGTHIEHIMPDALYRQQVKAIPFLIRKLLDDLRVGEKIFVRKGNDSTRLDQIMPLYDALRRHGPVTLLWVVPQDATHAPGVVEVLRPGLLKGYTDQFADYANAPKMSPVWMDICRGAFALFSAGSAPETRILIREPPETNPIPPLPRAVKSDRPRAAEETNDDDLLLVRSKSETNVMRLTALTPCRAVADIRVVLCGHAHTDAIANALIEPEDDGTPSPAPGMAEWLGVAGIRRPALSGRYWDLVQRLARTRDLVVVWNGLQHAARLLLAPHELSMMTTVNGVESVDETLVRQHLQPSLAGLDELLKAAGHPAGCQRIVLGTPPPLHDEELIRSRLHRGGLFAPFAKACGMDLATAPITSAAIRREFWRILQKQMAELAVNRGAVFIPVPVDVVDQHGCLHPRYLDEEVLYANARYGIRVMRDLAAALT